MKTTFATKKNPWTGKEEIEFVQIPNIPAKKKGTTGQDAMFNKMIEDKVAIELHQPSFDSIRRACQRYMKNNNLGDKYKVRQLKVENTYTMWFEEK